MKIKSALVCLVAIATTLGIASTAAADVPVIANPNLPDIGMTLEDPVHGTVIHMNPTVCAQVGPLVCNWFRNHEQSHANHGHTRSMWHRMTMEGARSAEREADCSAARRSTTAENNAAIQHFMMRGAQGDFSHGTGFERAQTVRMCSTDDGGGIGGGGTGGGGGGPIQVPPPPPRMCTQLATRMEIRYQQQFVPQMVPTPYGPMLQNVPMIVPVQVPVTYPVTVPCP